MKTIRTASRPIFLPLLLTVLLLAGVPAGAAEEPLPDEGTFSGDWFIEGTVTQVEVGASPVTLARLEGRVKLTTTGGLAREFDALCHSVKNEKTGGVARCMWTDDQGDAVLLELSGSIIGPAGTLREARGTVIGGTGRYAGIEGGIELDWLFVESTLDDSRFKGYVTKLEGHWKRPPSP